MFSAILTSSISFQFPLSSPSGISFYTFRYCPTVFGCSGVFGWLFVSFFFPLFVSVWEVSVTCLLIDSCFPQPCQVCSWEHYRHSPFLLLCFLFLALLMLWVLSLCFLICSCMSSTFFVSVFSIVVRVTSNSPSGNFYHCVMCFVLMVVSFLQILWGIFFLAVWHAL